MNVIRWLPLLLVYLLAQPVLGKDEDAGERCIMLTRIDSTRILDNQRIVFRMMGGKNYLNVLPHKCPRLRPHQPFMYRTTTSRLCDLDIITVLEAGNFGLRPLASCGLGRFHPMLDSDIGNSGDSLKFRGNSGDSLPN